METVSNCCDREFDVVLKAKDGTRIPAHIDVLSRSSSFFKSMVELCEKAEEVVNVDVFSGSYLAQFVEYCYTQNVTIGNMEILIEMVDFFQLNDAVYDTCLELMSKNLCVENILNFVVTSEKRGRNDLILSSMEFIDLFFDSMRTHDQFNELFVGTLQNILKRDTLTVSNEQFVFDAIVKWYKHDKRNREQYLSDLLKLVRLSDVDQTFITSIFLDFVAAHDCVQVFEATSEFLSQDDNSIHKKSNRRLADKIVAFNEQTIQFYVEKTKKWSHFKYLCDKSKAVAYEDRWKEKIEYFSLVFSDGYLSGVKKIQLTTGRTILENTLHRKSRVLRTISKIKVRAWTVADDSILFVAGYDYRFPESWYNRDPAELRCIQYDAKQNEWTNLPNIYQHGIFFHLVYIEPYLYAVGAAKRSVVSDIGIQWNTLKICRYNIMNKVFTWESCSYLNARFPDHPIDIYSDVGIVNGCIYLVSSSIDNLSTIKCFNPQTRSLTTVATLKEQCTHIKSIKVCGTKRYLYVVVDGESNDDLSLCQQRLFRFDPKENHGRNFKELDPLDSIGGDFQLVDVSNFD